MTDVDVTKGLLADAVLIIVMVVIDGSSAEAVDRTVMVGTGAVTVTRPLLDELGRPWKADRSSARAAVVAAASADDRGEEVFDFSAVLASVVVAEADSVVVTVIVTGRSVVTVVAEGSSIPPGATINGGMAGQLQAGGWTIIGPRAPGSVFHSATTV